MQSQRSRYGCRIGKVRLKSNGAEIYQLPSAREELSACQFSNLGKALANTRRHYTGKLDGYVLITWDHDGVWLCDAHIGTARHSLTLPEFVAEAVRQDYAEFLAARLVDKAFE